MKTILVADDSPSIRKLLETVLRSKGYSVILAQDGDEALKLALENDISAIISDDDMPNLSGRELFMILQTDPEKRSIPRIMISGLNVQDDEPVKEVADVFISKDTDLKSRLVAELERLL